jgi:RimJ/RimL family protein N-acetyltransferase
LVFATIDKIKNRVVGSTRFMKIDLPNRCLEIDFTFLAQSSQQTKTNTEAKLLMLEHAFCTLNINRVEFLTDYLNSKSKNAILRLGAKQDGILRAHRVMSDGRIRDSAIYSILYSEWEGVKQNLISKLSQTYR